MYRGTWRGSEAGLAQGSPCLDSMSSQQRRASLGSLGLVCMGLGRRKTLQRLEVSPPCWNAFSSCSLLVFLAQDPFPAVCLSHKVKQCVLVSRFSIKTVPFLGAGMSDPPQSLSGRQALLHCWHHETSLPLMSLSGNLLHHPGSLQA